MPVTSVFSPVAKQKPSMKLRKLAIVRSDSSPTALSRSVIDPLRRCLSREMGSRATVLIVAPKSAIEFGSSSRQEVPATPRALSMVYATATLFVFTRGMALP